MKSIRNKLSLATCSLLTTGNASAEAIENAWEVDSSYLYYSEVDRVTVNKLVGTAKGYVSTKDTASIKVVFDSMSGATPTGAVKAQVLPNPGHPEERASPQPANPEPCLTSMTPVLLWRWIGSTSIPVP